ncbi:hypothetical protein PR048_013864 [Dryococelus australis]|uniref:Maturase K n=1 Tax=Dryococelus australis TaxID=614101 RepID=A0ABQ9HU84_9NEOP|nr:hypothetical protein PR048_013864 [Dryococelus australis]
MIGGKIDKNLDTYNVKINTHESESPTKSKTEKIKASPAPTDTTQLKSYISLLIYYRQFIPVCQDLLEPLHNLLHKDVPWVWTSKCESAFNKSKTVLSKKHWWLFLDELRRLCCTTAAVRVNECNFLYLTTSLVSLVCLDKVAQETIKDQMLSKVIMIGENGWPHYCSNKLLKPFFTVQHQLSIRDRGPIEWQHVSHSSISPGKSVVHFTPWLSRCSTYSYASSFLCVDICRTIECCPACWQMQNVGNSVFRLNWPAPHEKWERIHLDLFHFNTVEYLIL